MKKTIAIVDPSNKLREVLENLLLDANYDIIASVDSNESIEFLIESGNIPNLILTELKDENYDGFKLLTYLKKHNENNENKIVPVAMSGNIDLRREAFKFGARQFIQKADNRNDYVTFYKKKLLPLLEMIQIEKTVDQSYVINRSKSTLQQEKISAIAIGVSTGGPKAINKILPIISKNHPTIPIFIVQHMPVNFTERFAFNLNNFCTHRVSEVNSMREVQNGHIYIAKGGAHMALKKGTSLMVDTDDSPPENNCKPSVDVFLRTFADTYGKNGLTIILTGMGNDGAKSLEQIKSRGGTIFVQDESSSVVWGMPGAAVKTGFVDKIISLEQIPKEISKILQ